MTNAPPTARATSFARARRPAPAFGAVACAALAAPLAIAASSVLVDAAAGDSPPPAAGDDAIATGLGLLDAGALEDAEYYLRAGLRKRPDDAAGRLGLGLVWLRQGDPERALRELERAQTLGSRDRRLDLELGRAHAALARFEAALPHLDRAEGSEAPLLAGFCLNRLARFEGAAERLEEARAEGAKSPEVHFELGWAYLELGRHADAAAELEAYEALAPGRGKAAELLGRAYLLAGRPDEAEGQLREALARDPSLGPTVKLYLALVASAQEDAPEARRRLREVVTEHGDSSVAAALERAFERESLPSAEPRSSLEVEASVGAGYDSNVIAIGQGQQLPDDIASRESAFGEARASIRYARSLLAEDRLTLGASAYANLYEDGLDDFEVLDPLVFADYRLRVAGPLELGVSLSDQYTLLDGEGFRNRSAVEGRARFWATSSLALGLAYTFGHEEYFFGTPTDELDRDALTHHLVATASLRLDQLGCGIVIGYLRRWNDAEGSDYDATADQVFVAIEVALPLDIVLDATYRHEFVDYEHANSLSGFARDRVDDVDAVGAGLDIPLVGPLGFYGRYAFVNHDSSVAPFDYDQHVVAAGIRFKL